MHQSQATASGTSTYDAARKAAENPVPQVSSPVGFGHPPPLDQTDQHVPGHTQSLIQTLQPYSTSLRDGNRGRGGFNTRGRTSNRRQNTRTDFPALNTVEKQTKNFFIIKAKCDQDVNLWQSIDTLKANKDLEIALDGPPKRVTELRNGTILIETESALQSQKIRQMTKLNNKDITIIEHPTLNFTKGTIQAKRFLQHDDQELLSELSKFGVVSIYRKKRKINNILTETGILILTFDTCSLPTNVKLGWTVLEVRKYIPDPRQCFKCQKYNHSSKSCRSPNDVCNRCGGIGHSGAMCTNAVKCANCAKPHQSNSRQCFFFSLEKEITTIQTTEKIMYRDAKKLALQKFIEPNKTFSEVLRSTIDHRKSSEVQRAENPPVNSTVETETTVEKPVEQNQNKTGAQKRDASSDSDNDSEQPHKRTHTEIGKLPELTLTTTKEDERRKISNKEINKHNNSQHLSPSMDISNNARGNKPQEHNANLLQPHTLSQPPALPQSSVQNNHKKETDEASNSMSISLNNDNPNNTHTNKAQELKATLSQPSLLSNPPPPSISVNSTPKFTVPSLHYKNPTPTKALDKKLPKNPENVALNNIPTLGSYDYHKSQQRSRSSSRDRKT